MTTIGSLFSGYAGLDAGVQQVIPAEVIWHSDIKPAAVKLLAHHWPDVPNLGDITAIDWTQVERPDILTGGFPCTDVSLAGARAGLHGGTRSGLFSEMLSAIRALRPALVVMENVRGLLSARGAEPTTELIAAWDERDRLRRITSLIESKGARAVRNGESAHVKYHQRDRVRIMGRLRRAVAAVKRADARIIRAIGTVLGSLADIGFDAAWYGIRASEVGAPHGRFRIFIIAWPAIADAADIRHERRGRARNWRGGSADGDLTDAVTPSGGRTGIDDRAGEPGARGSGQRVAGGSVGLRTPTDAFGCRGREDNPRNGYMVGDRSLQTGREESSGPHRSDSPTVADPSEAGYQGPQPAPRHVLPDGGAATDTDRDAVRLESVAELERGSEAIAELAIQWGAYGPAVRRWGAVLGRPAPPPTETGPKGGQRLSALLTEWMMGLPLGHITAVPGLSRNDMLSLAGDGVVPQQAAAALRYLLAATDSVRAA